MTAMTGPDLAALYIIAVAIIAISAWAIAKAAGWL